MIVSSLNQQEEHQQTSNHLENITQAYLKEIPELAHFYSYKKIQVDRGLMKRKRDRDLWRKEQIFCSRCGVTLKDKFYVNSRLFFKKRKGSKIKQIFLICLVCKQKHFLYLSQRNQEVKPKGKKKK